MELNDTSIDPHDESNADLPAIAGRPSPDAPSDTVEVSEDGNQIKRAGKTYIREEALSEARRANSELRRTVDQMAPLMPEFENFLRSRSAPDTRRDDGPRRSSRSDSDEEYSDDELEGLALVRGYYKPDQQTPDLERARRELDLMSSIADRRAGKMVRPVEDATIRDRAQAIHAEARQRKFVDGSDIADPKYTDIVFNSLPDEFKADPNIGNIGSLIAAGLEYLQLRKDGKLTRGRGGEPVFRESGAGRSGDGGTGSALDALDRAAAKARGKTPDQWAKAQKALGSRDRGMGTVLEEI